ncbi:MAG TPA: outer membrane protein assembly factor BamD [Candidatus Omnitrophota bacterium]|nr:outer membrane protein assembly factor BamD [Candidatus Omnitrophota bacterium]
MKISRVLVFIVILLLPYSFASADWVWSPEQGKFINTQSETQNDANDLFDDALDLYKEKKLDKAVEQFEAVLKQYPKSRVAPEAQYRLGTIFEEQGELVKAHKAYEGLIKSYPQSERFEEVVEREYLIGTAFLSGKKGKLMGLDVRPSLPLAIEVFKKIVEVAPYGAFGDKSQLSLGMAYQKSGRHDEALEAFQNLIEQYPQSSLVKEARLKMAEVSFEKSSAQTRDQSALDAAAQQAQNYLQRYPDSEEAEKAAKIRQVVDEINAEKNYRIGLYYEKDNYLESALIYYRDTAKRYSETSWGQKASEKLHALQEPVKYLNARADELQKKLKDLEAKYQSLGGGQKDERKQLKREIDDLKKQVKAIEKNKIESLNRRKQDLKRREAELKEKFKDLERKKKRYKNNTSPDFQKAIDRWQASLEAERDALAEEKDKLKSWRAELGVSDSHFYDHLIPFRGEAETPLQKIQQMDEKDLYKVSQKKKKILEEKEKLYKRYSELQKLLAPERSETGLMRKRLRGLQKQDASKPADPVLAAREKEIEDLEARLDEKKALYEQYFGKAAEQALELQLAQIAAGSQTPNPFFVEVGDLKGKNLEELLELKMHLDEQVAMQRNIVETLSTAFDRELALREQQELMKSVEPSGAQDVDAANLRKQIKTVEKDIRARYQNIQDRNKHKEQLLEALDEALNPRGDKAPIGKTLAKPVTGSLYLAKAFLFGLPNKDEELTREAKKKISDSQVKRLQDEIELESLMIQAREQEIAKLEKEREILNAKASLAGGMKFRSSLVKVPYVFIEEAVQSARRIVPKKDRKEVLLNRLDKQTKEFEDLKHKQQAVEVLIAEKTKPAAADAASAATPGKDEKSEKNEQKPEEKDMRDQVMRLQEELEVSYSKYAQEQGLVLGDFSKAEIPVNKENEKQYHEFEDVKAQLRALIDEELGVEQQEKKILEKRIQEADKILPTVTSKAMQQDLVTEKSRIGQRLADLAMRQDFLSREKERFSAKS